MMSFDKFCNFNKELDENKRRSMIRKSDVVRSDAGCSNKERGIRQNGSCFSLFDNEHLKTGLLILIYGKFPKFVSI